MSKKRKKEKQNRKEKRSGDAQDKDSSLYTPRKKFQHRKKKRHRKKGSKDSQDDEGPSPEELRLKESREAYRKKVQKTHPEVAKKKAFKKAETKGAMKRVVRNTLNAAALAAVRERIKKGA